MAQSRKLFTIGYEQVSSTAVFDELERAGVALLVDVRAISSSRRAGFSKNQLAAGLDERGIAYLHLKGLGTPKAGRIAARKGDVKTLTDIYRTHLDTPKAVEQMDQLAALVRGPAPVCLLCYERDHTHCHRTFIAEIIQERTQISVENLIAPRF